MINPGDRVVVAVSGGPDSVCLLDILYELRSDFSMELFAAHFDHGLRPDEDDAETLFVENLADSMGILFETGKADSGMDACDGSLEEIARDARYSFLDKACKTFFAQKIATGHNLNDQSETVLMRLLRGSGTAGLAGIPPKRDGRIIRPLIDITRDEIMAYNDQLGLKYITDSSNSETHFLRNRIRLDLLPRLKDIQPKVVELLGQTAEIMRRDDAWMEAESREWFEKSAEIMENREVMIPLPLFDILPDAMKYRVIRHSLDTAGGTLRRISLQHIESVISLVSGNKSQSRVDLPNGLIVCRIYENLVFKKGEGRAVDVFSYPLDGPGTFYLESLDCTILLQELEKAELPNKYFSSWIAFLNVDQISYPLKIRNFQPGDRFIPFGMTGHKKLKDFFIDLKIPAVERAAIPILTNNDKPIWVCGYRIDDRYKVTPDTGRVLKVTFLPPIQTGF